MKRWFVWIFVVVLWTALLEVPVPRPPADAGIEVVFTTKLIVAKSSHVIGYAILAALSLWTSVTPRGRGFLLAFVALHAGATEWMQHLLNEICGREGSLGDVGFDLLGMAIGLAASWMWWKRSTRLEAGTSEPADDR